MEAEDLMRHGRTKPQARREARILLGGAEQTRQAVRDARPFYWLDGLALDFRLGLRMLRKSWGLTLVGGIAITIATAIGVGASEFVRDLISPSLPLENGDRIVRLSYIDSESGRSAPASLYDLEVWRGSVSSLEQLGAYVTMEHGLVGDGGETGTVNLARISASAFELTRVPPLMGRFLIEADERPGAPAVVVLGYDVWQTLLAGDPDPIGRTVQLAGVPTAVVGVMPERYGFPEAQDAWTPFQVDAADLQPAYAPRANLFGRLVADATLRSARAELEVVGRRAAADFPDVYGRLSPTVNAFAGGPDGTVALILSGVRLVLVLLLVVVCANVATLVFARTVTREGEIAVRTALGATRRRIALQLVAEALVLVGGATVLGLLLARFVLGHASRLFFVIQQDVRPPFWWDDGLSPSTVVYALALAVVAALMIGVVPALKATRGAVHARLVQHSAGGGGLRFGGMWTIMVVLQVALSVALLPFAVSENGALGAMGVRAFPASAATDFPADEYLTAQLGRDAAALARTPDEEAAFLESSRRLFGEVRDRIAADPAVRGAALASGLSAMNHVIGGATFVDDGAGPPVVVGARILLVDRSYLGLMGATPVAGQSLSAADFTARSRSVVVNEAFVAMLGERDAVGGQIRFQERRGEASNVEIPATGTSVEIVGVVRNPGIDDFGPGPHPVIYAPLELAPVTPRAVGLVGMPQPPATQLFVRLQPDADPLGGRLYGIVAAVDPTLRLSQVGTAAETWGPVHQGQRLGAWIFMAVAVVVLSLSIAGVSALMAFTVSRRAREIAIRSAMGAPRGQIVAFVFRRVATQLIAGVALGSLIAVPVLWRGLEANEGLRSLVLLFVVLLGSVLAASLLPLRRALAIEPAAAIKTE